MKGPAMASISQEYAGPSHFLQLPAMLQTPQMD